MSVNETETFTRRIVNGAARVAIACWLLWLSAHLLARVWPWLLAIAVAVVAIRVAWTRWRASRDRW